MRISVVRLRFAIGAAALWLAAGTVSIDVAHADAGYDYYAEPNAADVNYNKALAFGKQDTPDPAAVSPTPGGVGAASVVDGTCYGAANCNSGCDDCNFCDCCQPLWKVRAGAVILTRNGPNLAPAPAQAVLDSGDFNWVGGPDIYLARRFNSTDWLEVRYFSVIDWNADYTLSDGLLYDGSYDAKLYSTEINVRRQYSDRFALLAGFRLLELHEQFNNELVGGGFGFSTDTSNYLYGAQIGADAVLWDRGGPFRVEGWAKAGIYGTHSQGHYLNTLGFDEISTSDQVSFVGDIAFTGVYQATDHIALRAGYQLLWIEGVALAGDQLQFSETAPPLPLDNNGGVFAHGVLLGVDLTW